MIGTSMPVWSDSLRIGEDAIDQCHQEAMTTLARLHAATRSRNFPVAERLMNQLSDIWSIHAQSEDEYFLGRDHGFAHETIDELIGTLLVAIRHRHGTDALHGALVRIARAVVEDVKADRTDMAWLNGGTPRPRKPAEPWMASALPV